MSSLEPMPFAQSTVEFDASGGEGCVPSGAAPINLDLFSFWRASSTLHPDIVLRGGMTWSGAMHRAASLSLAVAIGWTASNMWMNCSRQVRDDDLDDYLQETAHRAVEAGGVHDEVDVEGERDRIESGALAYLKANPECDVKMVFLVRTDLKMTKGKMCAQVAHAAVDAVDIANEEEWELMERWEECGCTKVCVKVESEEQLLEMAAAATARGLVTSVIEDAGRTQVEAGSRTVCGIGPGPAKLIDEVAGMLKLL